MGVRIFAGTPLDRPPKCERCGQLESECDCSPAAAAHGAPRHQLARLSLEKRKKGKMVTVIRGLAAEASDLAALLSRLKSRCGAGGTQKPDWLEIQGDHVERVRDVLREMGYRVKG